MDFSELEKFRDAFRGIIRTSRRSIEEEVIFKTRDLSIKLFVEFNKTSLKETDAVAFANKLNWKVRRPYANYPLIVNKGEEVLYKKGVNKGKVRKTVVSVKGELDRRIKAAKYIAASWLVCVRAFKRGYKTAQVVPVRHPRGAVTIEGVGTKRFTITITNSARGVDIVDAKYGHSNAAIRLVTEDMEAKVQERLNRELGIFARAA